MLTRWRTSRQNLLDRYAALRTEYDCLAPSDLDTDLKVQALIRRVETDDGVPKPRHRWRPETTDLRIFARLLVELYPDDALRVRIAVLSDDLTRICGGRTGRWWSLAAINEVAVDAAGRRTVLRELQRKRSSLITEVETGEGLRRRMQRNVSVVASIVAIVSWSATAILVGRCPDLPAALYTFGAGAGAIGAWLSIMIRIHEADVWGLAERAELYDRPSFSITFAPVIGVFSALVMVACLQSQFIGGNAVKNLDYKTLEPLCRTGLLNMSPDLGAPLVLILLAAMAAGWSERFVPDLLDWVGKKVRPTGSGATAAPTGARGPWADGVAMVDGTRPDA